jgi:hypothetical protein
MAVVWSNETAEPIEKVDERKKERESWVRGHIRVAERGVDAVLRDCLEPERERSRWCHGNLTKPILKRKKGVLACCVPSDAG